MLRAFLRFVDADPYGNLAHEATWPRLKKVLMPRYLVSKLALLVYRSSHPGEPWLTADAIRRLERFLTPAMRGLEWGSGEGSVWLARRSASLVSVEHNPVWYAKVTERLAAAGLTRVDYHLVAADEDRYTAVIDGFPDEHFDYVLVDGLFRDVALLKSLPKVRSGGWIIFDNANWYLPSTSRTPHSRSSAEGPMTDGFARAGEWMRSWQAIWTTNGVNDTAIFVKP